MVSFVEQGSETVCPKYAFGPSDHIPHGFGIPESSSGQAVVVGHLEVDRDVVLCICGGLDIVGHFGDVVADDYLSAVGIRRGYLLLVAAVKLFQEGFVFYPAPGLLFDLSGDGFLFYAVPVLLGKFRLVPGKLFFDVGKVPFDLFGVEVACPPQEGVSCCSGRGAWYCRRQ